VRVAGSGDGANGPPQASDPVAAGHISRDDGNTHPGSTRQGVSATETFSRQVEETAQMLMKKFEEEANDNAKKVRWSLILFY
jgi:hypothetical protein